MNTQNSDHREFNLLQVLERTGDSWQENKSGAIQVFYKVNGDNWDYFHLLDYIVSGTASGPSYWMVPRYSPESRAAGDGHLGAKGYWQD